jgi:hypothetical protein
MGGQSLFPRFFYYYSDPDENGKKHPVTPAPSRMPSSGDDGHRSFPRRPCRSSVSARILKTHGCRPFGSPRGCRAYSYGISSGTACPAARGAGRGTHHRYGDTCLLYAHRQRWDSSFCTAVPAHNTLRTGSSFGETPCIWRSPCRRARRGWS